MDGPAMKCTLSIEKHANLSKELLKSANLSLCRNEFRELLLVVEAGERQRKYRIKHEELVVHRKFAKEGKCSIVSKTLLLTFIISNAPPHQLVQFLKIMAAKLAGNRNPGLSARQKLISVVTNVVEGISPVTLKDVQNLKLAEAGNDGLLKMTMSPLTSGRTKKRTRLLDEDKENILLRSPASRHIGVKKQCTRNNLTFEQGYVLQAVREGKNVFFTGGAGVGKSFLIRKCIGILPPDCTFVTASTGVAAYQIGGVTLHSFAGIGTGSACLEQCLDMATKSKVVTDVWKKCKHLIIDEISMVDGRYFTKLEAVARKVRNCDKPFGGIQLILAGDFCQLPPVTRCKEEKKFCFETTAWRRSVHVNVELTEVKRQTDVRFIGILKELRKGKCSREVEQILVATKYNSIEDNGVLATKLCTHTDDVKHINQTELALLEGQPKTFVAVDSDPALVGFIDNHTPVESKLHLKVGAQVMLMRNQDLSQGLVNGARGCVSAFNKITGNPLVRFSSGITEEIKQEKWMVKGNGGVVMSRRQLPLKLAWAFSIHKSQGMTLDCVEMSLGRIFECGQAYVALSRARDLSSVRIVDFRASCIIADEKVLKFYREMRYTTPNKQTLLA